MRLIKLEWHKTSRLHRWLVLRCPSNVDRRRQRRRFIFMLEHQEKYLGGLREQLH